MVLLINEMAVIDVSTLSGCTGSLSIADAFRKKKARTDEGPSAMTWPLVTGVQFS
jgi:hypothetical protein